MSGAQAGLGERRQCPFCGDSVHFVKLPHHLDDECEDAPREVSY